MIRTAAKINFGFGLKCRNARLQTQKLGKELGIKKQIQSKPRNNCTGLGLMRRYFSSGQDLGFYLPFEDSSKMINRQNHAHVKENIPDKLIDKEAEDNFFMAYTSFVEAIVEDDRDFIHSVCEPMLAEKIVSDIEDLTNQGFRLEMVSPENPENQHYELSYRRMWTGLMMPFNRHERSDNDLMSPPKACIQTVLPQMLPNFGMKMMSTSSIPEISVLLTLGFQLNTNVGLALYNDKGRLIKGLEKDYLAAPLLSFTTEQKISILEMMSSNPSSMTSFNTSSMKKMFDQILTKSSADWFISNVGDRLSPESKDPV